MVTKIIRLQYPYDIERTWKKEEKKREKRDLYELIVDEFVAIAGSKERQII